MDTTTDANIVKKKTPQKQRFSRKIETDRLIRFLSHGDTLPDMRTSLLTGLYLMRHAYKLTPMAHRLGRDLAREKNVSIHDILVEVATDMAAINADGESYSAKDVNLELKLLVDGLIAAVWSESDMEAGHA